MKAALKLPRSFPVEVVVELEERKMKIKKNELSTILSLISSHDKIVEDGKPIVALSQMIREYSLEQMEKASKVGKSRYCRAREKITTRFKKTKEKKEVEMEQNKTGTNAQWGFKKDGNPKLKPGAKKKLKRKIENGAKYITEWVIKEDGKPK